MGCDYTLYLCLSLSGETPALYTVIPEKMTAVGGAMMGSSHVYDLGTSVPAAATTTTKKVRKRNYKLDQCLSELSLFLFSVCVCVCRPTQWSWP